MGDCPDMRRHWLLRAVLRIYNPAMTANAGPAFSLEYTLGADDLTDIYSTDDKVRKRRAWMACVLALCTAGAITLIAQYLASRRRVVAGDPEVTSITEVQWIVNPQVRGLRQADRECQFPAIAPIGICVGNHLQIGAGHRLCAGKSGRL